jgi:hypothetical protein
LLRLLAAEDPNERLDTKSGAHLRLIDIEVLMNFEIQVSWALAVQTNSTPVNNTLEAAFQGHQQRGQNGPRLFRRLFEEDRYLLRVEHG